MALLKTLGPETQCLSRHHGSTSPQVWETYWRAVAWFWNTHAATRQTSSSRTRLRFMGPLLPQALLDLCWPHCTWRCSDQCSLKCIIHSWPWLVETGAPSCQTPWSFPTHGPRSGHWCICFSFYWTTLENSGTEPNAVDFPPDTLDPTRVRVTLFWVARPWSITYSDLWPFHTLPTLPAPGGCLHLYQLPFLPRQMICRSFLVPSYFGDISVRLFRRMPLESAVEGRLCETARSQAR